MAGLSGLGSLTGGAALRANPTSGVGLPPSDMSGLVGMVQNQEQMTMVLLGVLMKLMQGQGGATGAGGDAAAGGGGATGTGEAGGTGGAAGAQDNGKVNANVGQWVTGDVQGLNSDLLNRLAQVGQKLGKKVDVTSGFRSRQEQEALYQKYLNGTGNLAAKPGSSKHESGMAADVSVDGQNLGATAEGRAAAQEAGLSFPVEGENWHVELAG